LLMTTVGLGSVDNAVFIQRSRHGLVGAAAHLRRLSPAGAATPRRGAAARRSRRPRRPRRFRSRRRRRPASARSSRRAARTFRSASASCSRSRARCSARPRYGPARADPQRSSRGTRSTPQRRSHWSLRSALLQRTRSEVDVRFGTRQRKPHHALSPGPTPTGFGGQSNATRQPRGRSSG
jgi:hypothetical protein